MCHRVVFLICHRAVLLMCHRAVFVMCHRAVSNTMDAITMCLDFFGLRDAEDDSVESEETESSEDSDASEDSEDGEEAEEDGPDVLEYIVFFTELLTCPGAFSLAVRFPAHGTAKTFPNKKGTRVEVML